MTKMKTFAAALMASTLLAAPALAQSNPPSHPAPAATTRPMTETHAATTAQQADQWRASKFVGLNVYNANNEKVGDINELILGKDGQVDLVVIGAGGFLGMGEHNVAVKWNDVKFVEQPVKSASTNAASRNTTGSGMTSSSSTVRDYPDHAMISMTKDQLKAMPAFKYNSSKK